MIERSTLYDLLVFLHILAAIAGFGTVFLNGVYGAQAKQRPGPGGVAIGEANLKVTMIAEWFIYSVPVTGILMLFAQGKVEVFKFSQVWVWLSLVLYVVALGISHGVQIPATKRMVELSRELASAGPPPAGSQGGPPPQALEMAGLEKKLAAGGGALHLLLVVILALMIWKPGV